MPRPKAAAFFFKNIHVRIIVMKKNILFLILLFCAGASCLYYAYDTNDSTVNDVVSFYSTAGNFYIDATAGVSNSLANLLSTSASFYKPLPEQVIFSYLGFGEKIISLGETSMDGVAAIGSLTSGFFGISFK